MVGIALAPNYLQLFIFWELTTVCSWALISFREDDKSLRAGFKALLVTHIGGVFFLVALLIMFVGARSFEFDAPAALSETHRRWIFLLLAVAAWAKAAQVPFHTWLPDAMVAPTPVSAYLHAAAMVKAGVFLMARTVGAGWDVPSEVALFLGVMAFVTIFLALSFYFVQDDLKRLLAYSTIAHLGYVLIGVALGALGSTTALRGGILHIACHSVAKATLFFCAGSIAFITGSRSISALGGLARSMPLTAVAFFVGILSVTGIPPFACFWSKLMLLAGAADLPGAIGPIVVGLILVESLISFGWMLHVAQKIFLGTVTPVCAVNSDPPWPMSGVLVILMLGCVVIPAIAMPLVNLIGR
jgi:hydrogenase-4 component D